MKIKDNNQLEDALLQLAQAQADIASKEAAMNTELQKIKENYAELIAEAEGNSNKILDAVEVYCKSIKSEFDKTRSLVTKYGTVGFRTNPPKVVQLNKKWKVESSLAFLKKLFGNNYLRTKPEINKESILADYAAEKLKDEDLAGVGLRIEQEETFYVDIDWETLQKEK